MTASFIKQEIKRTWDIPSRCADKMYVDFIDEKEFRKAARRWKYGFFGFFGMPLYHKESSDCDDLTRDLIVYLRKKLRVLSVALPIFYATDTNHAYVGAMFIDGLRCFDYRDLKFHDVNVKYVEML